MISSLLRSNVLRKLRFCVLLLCCAFALLLGAAGKAAAEPAIGINASWGDLNPPEEERTWEVLEQSGASTLRFQFSWYTKLAEGGWTESYDRYVEKAARHGITIQAYFFGRSNNSSDFYTAAEAGPWLSEFVEPAVARYGEGGAFWAENPTVPYRPITAWEVWNEPNFAINNPGGVVNHAAYRDLLKVASNAIHAVADSRQTPNNAKVLFGGIYQGGGEVEDGVTYFNKVAKGFGLFPYFEGVGIHPYAFGGEKATQASRLANFKEKVEGMREAVSALCVSCGQESLWVTEVGWPTNYVIKPVSEAEQAWLLTESFSWMQAQSSALNLPLMAWFSYKSDPAAAWYATCGLRRSDGTYTESWWVFANQATGHPMPASAGGVEMLLDPAGQVWATTTLGQGWAKETPVGETAISAGGGNLQMILDGGGQIWARNTVGEGGWTQETGPGHAAISAGQGVQMLLDGGGQVWATTTIGNSWAQGTGPGHLAISAGGGGLQMLLDGGGQVWARNSVFSGWTQETGPGHQKISAGGGIQMLLDGAGQVWAATSIGGAFTQETPPGHTAIDAGEGGLQMTLDGAGQVWARTGIGSSWTLESGPGQKAISAGSGGLQMRLDSKGQVWAKASIGWGGWALVAPASHVAIAAG